MWLLKGMPEVKNFRIGDADGVVRGPLAVYPLLSFEELYLSLKERFGELSVTTSGYFLTQESDKLRGLLGRGDFASFARFLDERNPEPWKTNLVVEFPDGEKYIFAKLLVDSNPSYLTLNVLSNGHEQSRLEALAEGAIFDILPGKAEIPCMTLREVAEKYHIPRKELFNPIYTGNFNLGFVGMLGAVFDWLKIVHPKAYSDLFEKKDLVVGDIGCGIMHYSNPLAYYFSVIHGKNTKLVGIDLDTSAACGLDSAVELFEHESIPNASLVTIPAYLEDSAPYLGNKGINSFDLLTMFNPRDVINIEGLPETFRERAPVLVALDYPGASIEEVAGNLADNGYSVLLIAHNPFCDDLRSIGRNYTPIILAKPILSMVEQK